jgi:hypothetical protein
MKAKLIFPLASMHGTIGRDYYIRMVNGKQVIQRCPRRRGPATAAQIAARKAFAEKYAGNKGKVRDAKGVVTEC